MPSTPTTTIKSPTPNPAQKKNYAAPTLLLSSFVHNIGRTKNIVTTLKKGISVTHYTSMENNDIVYLIAFITYIVLCFVRCKPCCRNSNNEDGDFEGTLPVEMTKTQRLDFIKERLVVKKAANRLDFSIHSRCSSGVFNNEDQDEIEGAKTGKEPDSDSLFKSLASSIRSITSKASLTIDSRKQCPICIDEYEIGDEICSSPNEECPHVFHVDCMTQWLLKHGDCPLCRADYLEPSKKADGIRHEGHVDGRETVDLETGNVVSAPRSSLGD